MPPRRSSSKKTGRSTKTQSGVQAEFARLAKREPAIDAESRAFLGWAFNLKAIADYDTGAGSRVTLAQAAETIVAARRFVAAVEEVIGP
jgi:uncharacterized protein (UPF0332 family)